MIKFNIKNFFKGDVEQEPSIEVEVQLPQETRKEVFDKAVQEETRKLLKKDLKKALFVLVYGEEAYEQTVALSSKAGGWSTDVIGVLGEKYPKARWAHRSGTLRASFEVSSDDLIGYLVDEALGSSDDTETKTERG